MYILFVALPAVITCVAGAVAVMISLPVPVLVNESAVTSIAILITPLDVEVIVFSAGKELD